MFFLIVDQAPLVCGLGGQCRRFLGDQKAKKKNNKTWATLDKAIKRKDARIMQGSRAGGEGTLI
jgi:hypothetical protein